MHKRRKLYKTVWTVLEQDLILPPLSLCYFTDHSFDYNFINSNIARYINLIRRNVLNHTR